MNLLSVIQSVWGVVVISSHVLLFSLANFLKIVAITAFIMIPMPLIIVGMLAS